MCPWRKTKLLSYNCSGSTVGGKNIYIECFVHNGLPRISTTNRLSGEHAAQSVSCGHPCHNGNVCDFAAIEPLCVVRTAAASADAVLHGFEFDKVAGLATTQALETVVWRVLENVEGVCNVQVAFHPVRLHGFGNVRGAGSVARSTFFLVHFREAAHKGHVVYLDCVFHELQDWLVVVCPEILSHGGRDAVQAEARVRHAQLLDKVSALHPSSEIHDLFAMQVDNTETLALLHLERKAVGGFADERLRAGCDV